MEAIEGAALDSYAHLPFARGTWFGLAMQSLCHVCESSAVPSNIW